MITKYASAAQRSTVDTCRTLIIWCVFLALGKEKFLVGELFGFALLVLGTLVYNEIIEMPINFMSKNTKRNIQKREQEELAKNSGKRAPKGLVVRVHLQLLPLETLIWMKLRPFLQIRGYDRISNE